MIQIKERWEQCSKSTHNQQGEKERERECKFNNAKVHHKFLLQYILEKQEEETLHVIMQYKQDEVGNI